MTRLCSQCEEKPAVTGNQPWYAALLLFVFGFPSGCEGYCVDCAGGRNFIALLFAIIVALAAFVLLVVFW